MKPADAFNEGELVRHEGSVWTVTSRRYLEDKRSTELGLAAGKAGKSHISRPGELLEVAEQPSWWRRLIRRR